jgi:CspA family cold shock protein
MVRLGTVTWFNDHLGYGFIEQSQGPPVYVHHTVIEMAGYRTLRPGMRVVFDLEEAVDTPRARRVSLEDI